MECAEGNCVLRQWTDMYIMYFVSQVIKCIKVSVLGRVFNGLGTKELYSISNISCHCLHFVVFRLIDKTPGQSEADTGHQCDNVIHGLK